jgi:hypothetical protein
MAVCEFISVPATLAGTYTAQKVPARLPRPSLAPTLHKTGWPLTAILLDPKQKTQ